MWLTVSEENKGGVGIKEEWVGERANEVFGEKRERGQTMKWEKEEAEKWQRDGVSENELHCVASFQSVGRKRSYSLRRWALSAFIRLLRCVPRRANLPRPTSKRALMHTAGWKNRNICRSFSLYPVASGESAFRVLLYARGLWRPVTCVLFLNEWYAK